MSFYWASLTKVRSRFPVCLANNDFDLRVFGVAFKIAVAVDGTIEAHFLLIVEVR